MCEFRVTVTVTVESEVANIMILSDILHNVATETCHDYCYITPLTSSIMPYLSLSSGFPVMENPPFLR